MRFLFLVFVILVSSCQTGTLNYDLLIINGSYYTASPGSGDTGINALGVKDGRISLIGKTEDLEQLKSEARDIIDATGLFIMPGFIEGHGHFSGLGKSLQNLNFLNDTSWAQIVTKVQNRAKETNKGAFIYGRGWHQEKWRESPASNTGGYPTHHSLSSATPDNPVILYHASGHALFANAEAMRMAGVTSETPDPRGGKIIRDASGKPTGVFEERAMNAISMAYQSYLASLSKEQQDSVWYDAIDKAQAECIENGVTSFQDAGSKFHELEKFEALARAGALDIRLWVMARHSSKDLHNKVGRYRKIGIGNHFYTCRAIKSEVDGALGAHGAWLLEPYTDKPGFYGQNTTDIDEVAAIADIAYDNDMQLCVHAIGDRANKEVLDIIEEYHNRSDDNLRWRVEHAQHLNPADIMRFRETGALASMQGVHCTSDAPFVVKRLGMLRSKIGAYAWKALLQQDVLIINGTDVPVEDIDPIRNFYASVTRKRTDNGMTFFVEQRMSREEALRSYTIDAAYGAFEEDEKGSLEVGKLGDIVIINKNLLTCDDLDILNTQIMYTIVDGKIKFRHGE